MEPDTKPVFAGLAESLRDFISSHFEGRGKKPHLDFANRNALACDCLAFVYGFLQAVHTAGGTVTNADVCNAIGAIINEINPAKFYTLPPEDFV